MVAVLFRYQWLNTLSTLLYHYMGWGRKGGVTYRGGLRDRYFRSIGERCRYEKGMDIDTYVEYG